MQNRSRWWQSPRRVADRESNRRITFLELFYDLIYVVTISELDHRLSGHLDGHGLLVYVGMFVVVWWGWFNGTMYHDLHGNDDLRTRVFTFLQMIAVGAMAVFAHDAVGEYSAHFAISYAALQLILAFLWMMTGVADPDHRPLSTPYTITMLISTSLFVGSAFVEGDTVYTMWLIAMVVSLVGSQLPVLFSRRLRPEVRAQIDRSRKVSESAVERFGLFTIIVLGEVIIGVVRGLIGHHHLDWTVGAIGILGMIIAIGLWWIYFDFVSLRVPREGLAPSSFYFYLHLIMTMAIAAVGGALLHAVETSPESPGGPQTLIFVGAAATAMLCVAGIGLLLDGSELHLRIRRTARLFLVVCAAATIVIGAAGVNIVVLLGSMAVLLLIPVFAGFLVALRGLRDIDEAQDPA